MKFSRRKKTEFAMWLAVFVLLPLVLATTEIMEDIRDGVEIVLWKPFLEEYSSAFVVLLLIPCILFIDRRMPIATREWGKRLLIHIPLSMAFSLVHIAGMFGIRKGVYYLLGENFSYDALIWLIPYEYRKDLVVYIAVMLGIYAYREISRLRQGEAQLTQAEDESEQTHILVSKRGLFHFVEPASIHWVEAAGNYVELHVGDETYMLRSTMKEIEERLGQADFVRIHRSTIVNRNQIDRVVPARNGDSLLVLHNNAEFRFSRRYRKAFEARQSSHQHITGV